MVDCAQTIIASVVSFAVGWFGNALASRRDRQNRKRELRRKAGEWRTRIYRCQVARILSANFPAEVARFGGNYIAIEQDIVKDQRSRFHILCDQIVTMTDSEVEETTNVVLVGKAKLLTRIEAIISLLEQN